MRRTTKYSYGMHLSKEEERILQDKADRSGRTKRNVVRTMIMNSENNAEFDRVLGIASVDAA